MHKENQKLNLNISKAEVDKYLRNIRYLCALTIENANSGHPGAPLALTPLLFTLFSKYIIFDPDDPESPFRDIFLMSNGHSCAVHYVILTLIKYLKLQDIKDFRVPYSRAPGHPERLMTPGIEVSLGPLGQGVANAVGFAIALKRKNISQHVYCTFGDGCFQEGMSHEAFSIAGHLNLNNITFIYDSNKTTIEGHTDISMSDDATMRFKSYGFYVIEIQNTVEEIERALDEKTEKVKMIILNTRIAEGSNREGDHLTHGFPLGQKTVCELREDLGIDFNEFKIIDDLKIFFEKIIEKRREEIQQIKKEHFAKLENFKNLSQKIKFDEKNYREILEKFRKNVQIEESTRKHVNIALSLIMEQYENVIGGSADLTPSNLTFFKNMISFTRDTHTTGNYIHYGIREHAMIAIMNGIAAEGTFVPYSGTFMNFMMYGFSALRVGAMDDLHVVNILTHDSIGLGEDGPTHQPVEVLAALRATPRVYTFRPCDGVESLLCLKYAFENKKYNVLSLSRHKLPVIKNTGINFIRGCYLLKDEHENPDGTIIATGSEVHLALKVADKMRDNFKINVGSMVCTELFDEQPEEYRKSILKGTVISLELQSTICWYKYAHYPIGVDKFGMSAKVNQVYSEYGFTVDKLKKKIENFLSKI